MPISTLNVSSASSLTGIERSGSEPVLPLSCNQFAVVWDEKTCGGLAAGMELPMLSFMERLEQARAELAQRETNPLHEKVAAAVAGKEAIGTAPLCDLIGLPKTTGNARRIATVMKGLGYVPIKTRRFLPGGHRGTVTRGWARPIRDGARPAGSAER